MKLTMVMEKSDLKYPYICKGAFFMFRSGNTLHLKLEDGFCEVGGDGGTVYGREGSDTFDGDSIKHMIIDEIILRDAGAEEV